MPTFTQNNHSIFYSWNRIKSDSALILIHGAGGRHIDWPKELRHNRQISTYSIDLPGHFKSTSDTCKEVDEMGEMVIAFINDLGLSSVYLLGHSMGGAIAQYIGIKNPDWLSGLILVGTAPKMPVSPMILDQIHTNLDAVGDFIIKYAFARNARGLVKGAVRKIIMENDPDVLYADFNACNHFNFTDELAQIEADTLVVAGKRDKFTPLKESEIIASGVQNGTLTIMDAGGHYMFVEQPIPFARLILRYLSNK